MIALKVYESSCKDWRLNLQLRVKMVHFNPMTVKSFIFTVLLLPSVISANIKGRPSQLTTPTPSKVTTTVVPSKVNPDRDIYTDYGDFSASEESQENVEVESTTFSTGNNSINKNKQTTVVPYTVRPSNNRDTNPFKPTSNRINPQPNNRITPINNLGAGNSYTTKPVDNNENRIQFITETIPNKKYPNFSQLTTPKNSIINPDNFVPDPIPHQPDFYKTTVAPRKVTDSSQSTLRPRFFGISPSRNLRPDYYNNNPTKLPETLPTQFSKTNELKNSQSQNGYNFNPVSTSRPYRNVNNNFKVPNSGTNNFGNTGNKIGPISTSSNTPSVNKSIQSGPLSGSRNEPFGNTNNKNQNNFNGGINNHGNTGNKNGPSFGINNHVNTNKNGSNFGINNHGVNGQNLGNKNGNNLEKIDFSNQPSFGPVISTVPESNSENTDQNYGTGSNTNSKRRPVLKVDEHMTSTSTMSPKLVIPWNAQAQEPNSGVQIEYAKKQDSTQRGSEFKGYKM